jgi:hypothetical protein
MIICILRFLISLISTLQTVLPRVETPRPLDIPCLEYCSIVSYPLYLTTKKKKAVYTSAKKVSQDCSIVTKGKKKRRHVGVNAYMANPKPNLVIPCFRTPFLPV